MTSAIIVLGKGIRKDGILTESGRIAVTTAAELFNSSRFDLMVMSGCWSHSLDYIPARTEAEAMKAYAMELDIPADRILKEETSLDTIGNAYYTKRLLDRIGNVNEITVVTVDFHVARSRYIFEKIFEQGTKIDFSPFDISCDPQALVEKKMYEERALATIKGMLEHAP